MRMALSIITIDVNGSRDVDKRSGVVKWLQALPSLVDIVCLQEVHCTSAEECSRWFSSTGLSCVVSSGSAHSCGCVVLYRPRLSLDGSCQMLMVGLYSASSLSRLSSFVLRVFMRQIAILLLTTFFLMLRCVFLSLSLMLLLLALVFGS